MGMFRPAIAALMAAGAFSRGRLARIAGHKKGDNPYPESHCCCEYWEDGYRSVQSRASLNGRGSEPATDGQ